MLTENSWLRLIQTAFIDALTINWRDVQRQNVVNNVDMSSLRAPWQNGRYKNKHTEQHKNTQNTKTQQTFKINYFCVFQIFIYLWFLKWFLQKMLSYRLGTVNDFHWKFKPVSIYSKPHTFSTLFEEEKEKKCAFTLLSGYLEHEQSDRTVKRSIF